MLGSEIIAQMKSYLHLPSEKDMLELLLNPKVEEIKEDFKKTTNPLGGLQFKIIQRENTQLQNKILKMPPVEASEDSHSQTQSMASVIDEDKIVAKGNKNLRKTTIHKKVTRDRSKPQKRRATLNMDGLTELNA